MKLTLTYPAPHLTAADLAAIRDIRVGDVVLDGRTAGVVTSGHVSSGMAWVRCAGGPLGDGTTHRFTAEVRATLDVLIPAGTPTLPLLCPCVPLAGLPMCCPKPGPEPVSPPAEQRVPDGATVTYRGSLREWHGRYVVIGPCHCYACLPSRDEYGTVRYELSGAGGALLTCVSRKSIEYRAP